MRLFAGEQGKFGNTPGQSKCPDCPPGRFADITGLTFCLGCKAGRFSAGSQGGKPSIICPNCTAGKYSNVDGLEECSSCPPATYSFNIGASACLSCPEKFGTTCIAGLIVNARNSWVMAPVDARSSAEVYPCPVNLCLENNQCATNRKNWTENVDRLFRSLCVARTRF